MSKEQEKEPEQYFPVIFVLIVASLLSAYQFYSDETISVYEPYSIVSESLVMLFPLAGVVIVQKIQAIKFVYIPLMYLAYPSYLFRC